MDYYVESPLADPDFYLPAMRSHLTDCSACAEETVSQLELAAADAGIDLDAARRRLPSGARSSSLSQDAA
jgi:hypothetical protein